MPTEKNLALIGAGHWGKNLARNFHTLGALHTICDERQSLLNTYTTEYQGVKTTTNFNDVLNDKAIASVAIATPAATHYSLAKQALLAGKDVFVEKPLCLNTADGEELITLAEKQGKILMVGHLLHYHPAVIRLQEMVAKGDFGQLQYVASHRLSLGQVRTEENNLWSFAPHDISVILSLLGRKLPSSVRCTGHECLTKGIADMAITILEFPQGINAHIYTSWLHPFKEQKLVVVGSNGMAVFDDTQPWGKKLLYFRGPVAWENGTTPRAQKVEGEAIDIKEQEPLKEECAHFLMCCRERTAPRTGGAEGLGVLRVLQAAQESLDSGGDRRFPAAQARNYFAHPTALVDKGAAIGSGTKIWHFSHIMNNSVLGSNCNIGQNVVISPEVVLGSNVKVQNNVSVYTGVICEDNVFLGPSMVFTNVMNPRSAINRRGEYQQTLVRHGATIGANATIVCGTELGAFCFIGAGAVVTKDVKPFALMVGNPARQIGWMSRTGERLDLPVSAKEGEVLEAACPATGERYLLTGSALELEAAEETAQLRN